MNMRRHAISSTFGFCFSFFNRLAKLSERFTTYPTQINQSTAIRLIDELKLFPVVDDVTTATAFKRLMFYDFLISCTFHSPSQSKWRLFSWAAFFTRFELFYDQSNWFRWKSFIIQLTLCALLWWLALFWIWCYRPRSVLSATKNLQINKIEKHKISFHLGNMTP